MKKSKLASGLTAAFFGATILSGLFISFAAPIAHAQPFKSCQQMSDSFGATPNNFRSKLNDTQEKQWIANKCKTTPGPTPAEVEKARKAAEAAAAKAQAARVEEAKRAAAKVAAEAAAAKARAALEAENKAKAEKARVAEELRLQKERQVAEANRAAAKVAAEAAAAKAQAALKAPAPAAQNCQQMSDATGLDAIGNNGRTSPGRASREEQQRFANMGCETRPKGAAPASFMGCQQMSDQLGTNEGAWGRANPAQQQQWTANKCKTRPTIVAPPPPQPVVSQAQMVAEGIKKVDLWEKNTTSQIDKDRLAMLIKIKQEERNNDMMGRRMNSVNEIAKRDMENVRLGAVERRKCFTTEKRDNCFERP